MGSDNDIEVYEEISSRKKLCFKIARQCGYPIESCIFGSKIISYMLCPIGSRFSIDIYAISSAIITPELQKKLLN